MKCNFLKTIEEKVIFDGEYMEIYIPRSNFSSDPNKPGISSYEGEYLKTLGTFNFLVYPEGKESQEKAILKSLNLPMKIKIGYTDSFKITTKLESDYEPVNYTVFCLEKGDIFCLNLFQEKSSQNTKETLFLIHGGKLPKAGSYDNILDVYLNSTLLNDVNLDSPLVIFEFIVAELNRWKEDATVPFRQAITDPSKNVSEYDYAGINLKKLPSLNSTYSALTFEDINQSVISSVKKTKNNEPEKESPMEDILKY